MSRLYRTLATSEHPAAQLLRAGYRAFSRFSLPAPRAVVVPVLFVFLALRSAYHFLLRTLVCEPLFKAYCTRHGRGVRTDVYVHWVQGRGRLIVGDDVLVDGKCSFTFAQRFSESPTLEIGDGTGIGHGSSFTVARRITIGRNCRIAGGVRFFDSSGHPSDPEARRQGRPPAPEEVRPITVGDNVWIGSGAFVFPGVTIGENSVVAAGAVVTGDVPADTVVAGNPARRVAALGTKETR